MKNNTTLKVRNLTSLHKVMLGLFFVFIFSMAGQAQNMLAPSKASQKVEQMKQSLVNTIASAGTQARVVNSAPQSDINNSVKLVYYDMVIEKLKEFNGQGSAGTLAALNHVRDRFVLDPNIPQSRLTIINTIHNELYSVLQ